MKASPDFRDRSASFAFVAPQRNTAKLELNPGEREEGLAIQLRLRSEPTWVLEDIEGCLGGKMNTRADSERS